MPQSDDAAIVVPAVERCCRCTLQSTIPELFRPWRNGRICPRCFEQRHEANSKWCLVTTGFGVLLAALLWTSGREEPGLQVGGLAGILLATMLLVPLHELAHAGTALALGMKVHSIVIGSFGRAVLRFRLGRCQFEVTNIPVGGMTHLSSLDQKWLRLRYFFVIAAGPLLHVLLAAVSCIVLFQAEDLGFVSGTTVWFATVLGWANVALLVSSILPIQTHTRWGSLGTDGVQLFTIPFLKEEQLLQHASAYFYYESTAYIRDRNLSDASGVLRCGLEKYPDHMLLKFNQALLFLELDDYTAAADIFEELRKRPEATREMDAVLLNNIAWAHLVSRNRERLTEARALSERALEALPWRPELKGTLGAILVMTGELPQGIALLQEAWTKNTDHAGRACNALFLAVAAAKRGDRDPAYDWIHKAERLDPRGRQLHHVRLEVTELLAASSTDVQR